MRKMIFALVGLATLLVSANSCKKDTTIRYSNETMGNVVNGIYTTDQGNIFNIVEQGCPGKIDTMKRVYTVSDVIRKTAEGEENEYDIRLHYIIEPLDKPMVIKSEATEEELEEIGDDPIDLVRGWFSGGYINIIFQTEFKKDSKVKHFINLVVDDSKTEDGKLFLELRHNAYGETNAGLSSSNRDIIIGSSLATFPISNIVPDDVDEVDVYISYSWFEDIYSNKVEEKTIKGRYVKGGFEHTPTETTQLTRGIEIK